MRRHNRKSALAVYIGAESTEILQMTPAKKGTCVSKGISKRIQRKEVTGDIIRDMLHEAGIKDTSVITTVPEEDIMIRRFTMPFIPRRDRKTAVSFEAKKHIPFNIPDVISAFHTISENRKENNMEILFAAVRKDAVSPVISALKDAGLTVEEIEPAMSALAGALTGTGVLEKRHPPHLIVYFETENELHITAAENGILYLKRDTALTGKKDTRDKEIEKEIRLTRSYYKRDLPHKDITGIIICGENGSSIDIKHLQEALGLPVQYVVLTENTSAGRAHAPHMDIPGALCRMILGRHNVRLNLAPKKPRPAGYNTAKIITAELGAAVCIFALAYAVHMPAISRLKKQIASSAEVKEIYPGIDLRSKTLDELDGIINSIARKRGILLASTRDKVKWGSKLKRLSDLIPKSVWITELAMGDSAGVPGSRFLIIKGYTYAKDPAQEIEITNNFSKALKNDKVFMQAFKKLSMGSITKGTIDGYAVVNFDISASSE